MDPPETSGSRRELIAKLLPFIAVSAIKMGVMTSPLGIITSAANRYNETVERPAERIGDLLPLLPGIEKLRVEVNGAGSVALTLERGEVSSCAEEYLRRLYSLEGGGRTRVGVPSSAEGGGTFGHVLRLPSRNIYLKVTEELTQQEAASLLDLARRMNPSEVLIVADTGAGADERLDPVFVSENKIMRGRFRSISTAEMLAGFFGNRFTSQVEFITPEEVKVTLGLRSSSPGTEVYSA